MQRAKNHELPAIMIFPEGTTSNGKCGMAEFKKGLYVTSDD